MIKKGEVKMTVSKQIIEVLNALCKKIGIAVDWTAKNVAPYLSELCSRICSYEIATSIFWLVIGVIILISAIIYYKHSWKNPIDWDEYDITSKQVNGILSVILLVVSIITSFVMITMQTLDIIQLICLPELTIIDYIKDLTTTIK
jgi:hypothetical protein